MEILKVTLKREFCDDVNSGSKNYFYFEPKKFWIKRFASDSTKSFEELKGTKDFKKYDFVEVSCFGGEKYNYRFDGISTGVDSDDDCSVDDHTGFCVYVTRLVDGVPVEDDVPAEEVSEEYNAPSEELEDVVEHDAEPDVAVEYDDAEPENQTLIERVNELLDIVSSCDNIYTVNIPHVMISDSGHIIGTKKYVKNMRIEGTLKFNIGTEVIEYDVEDDNAFILKFGTYLSEIISGNVLFIWRNGTKIIEREDGTKYLKLKISIKKRNR